MKALKVLMTAFVIFAQLLSVAAPAMAESSPMEKRKLLVTAYYSPLPNQSFYIRGTYEADIRLNGRGTNGADGTEVYVGMLAAPRTYPFGTRVKIPGLGVGEVHDRGGAILAHKDYDRIDVWMGHGEEGLARALNWGAPIVDGEVYWTPHQVEPGLSFDWVSSTLPASYVERLRARTAAASSYSSTPTAPAPAPVVEPEPATPEDGQESEVENEEIKRLEQNRLLLAAGLGKDAEGEDVINLQRMLWDLGYYDGEIDGIYDQGVINAVFQFQIENNVVNSEYEAGAGFFGKKTLAALLTALDQKISRLAEYPKIVQVWVPAKIKLPQIASLDTPEIAFQKQELHFAEEVMNKNIVQDSFTVEEEVMNTNIVQDLLTVEMDLNDQSDEVAKLQNLLIRNGYLEAGLNTGYFGNKTSAAVLKFQMEKGIVQDPTEPGAGRVGPMTLAGLNLLY